VGHSCVRLFAIARIARQANTCTQKYIRTEIRRDRELSISWINLSRATPQSRTAFPPALGGIDHVGDQRKSAEDQHYSREGYRCEIHFFPA
jgi:hypothetical protein